MWRKLPYDLCRMLISMDTHCLVKQPQHHGWFQQDKVVLSQRHIGIYQLTNAVFTLLTALDGVMRHSTDFESST